MKTFFMMALFFVTAPVLASSLPLDGAQAQEKCDKGGKCDGSCENATNCERCKSGGKKDAPCTCDKDKKEAKK